MVKKSNKLIPSFPSKLNVRISKPHVHIAENKQLLFGTDSTATADDNYIHSNFVFFTHRSCHLSLSLDRNPDSTRSVNYSYNLDQ